MKTNFIRHSLIALALAGGMFLADSAPAAISGINTPVASFAQIQFIDTTSLDPSFIPGITSINQSVSSWNGATYSLASTTDPVTSDTAQGDITASFLGNSYTIALNNVVLTQAPLNTGFAHLIFSFSVEFQLDALGLPSQPTLFPNFLVNGTVQSTSGSFAAINGFIDYYGVNATTTRFSILRGPSAPPSWASRSITPPRSWSAAPHLRLPERLISWWTRPASTCKPFPSPSRPAGCSWALPA
jgi:hypothetical protein